MSQLISISPPDYRIDIAELEAHRVHTMPVLVISPHNQCDCHCVMCDIWKIRQPQEFSVADLAHQLASFRALGVQWVVFTGGEPQKNSHLPILAKMLRAEGIRVTLLTAGLLLESQAELIVAAVDDVIVSLDGPPPLHNGIRRVPKAFERLADGVRALRELRNDIPISARCTVQKLNHRSLRATVASARDIGLNSISFLAADVASSAFNHLSPPSGDLQETIALNAFEVDALEQEIECLIHEHGSDITSSFIAESPAKLQRIVLHFRASLGQVESVSPRCNAPWVSAVVEASGEVRPCFFHRSLGNTRDRELREIMNSPEALQFRAKLDIATDPICRRCVCSLYIPDPRKFAVKSVGKALMAAVPKGSDNG
jgi:MoaA/NifB/PqqE/SkfB family radical SAM enzyme